MVIFMKKKILIIIIVISFFTGIIVLNNIYMEKNYFADHLICTLKESNEYYSDTFDFMYVEDISYKVNRTEEYKSTGKNSLDEAYKFYEDLKKEYDNNTSKMFTFEIDYKKDNYLKINTFIKSLNNEEVYTIIGCRNQANFQNCTLVYYKSKA